MVYMIDAILKHETEEYCIDKAIIAKIASLGFGLYEDNVMRFHWLVKWVDEYFV